MLSKRSAEETINLKKNVIDKKLEELSGKFKRGFYLPKVAMLAFDGLSPTQVLPCPWEQGTIEI